MRKRPVGRPLAQRAVTRKPFEIREIRARGRQEMPRRQPLGQRGIARAQGAPRVIGPRPGPGRGIAQRLGAGRTFQHQGLRQIVQPRAPPPAKAVERQPAVLLRLGRQRKDQPIDARPPGLKRDARPRHRLRPGACQREDVLGPAPFAPVQKVC